MKQCQTRRMFVISDSKRMRTRLTSWVISVTRSEHSCSARAGERCKVFGVLVFHTLNFERRSRAANQDDYERKTLWSRGGVGRTHVFNSVLSLCYHVHNHAQCTLLVDSRSSS